LSLPDQVLERPRGTLVVFAALLLVAVISLGRVPIEGTPDATLPKLNVSMTWPGADPEVLCEQVTRPVEEAAREIDGVVEVSSTSWAGSATVTVSFEKGTDMDVASLKLTEKLSFLKDELPEAVSVSSISQAVPRELTGEGFLVYAITGAERPVLGKLAEEIVIPRLERIDGVSSVIVEGLGRREIVVDLDMDVLHAYDLTVAQVANAVRFGTLDRNVGVVTDSSGLEAVLRISTVPGDVTGLGDIVVAGGAGRFVKLSDVAARIFVSYDAGGEYIFRYDGMDQVSLQVDRATSSNAVAVARRVKGVVENLADELPSGVELHLIEDGTRDIIEDLRNLSWRALVSLCAISVILLLLNGSPFSALLILSSILFSAALSVTAVFLAGYSINILTISALAIAFGLLVDGAVVVLESIGYHRRKGLPPIEAARIGAEEVAIPIFGGILTTVIALVPLLTSEGVLRLYYKPLMFTITATLAASYLVCLTLVPSVAGRWQSEKWYRERKWDRKLAQWIATLHHRSWVPVVFTVLLVAGAVWVFVTKVEKGKEWGFSFESDYVMVRVQYPPGTPRDVVDRIAGKFEEILAGRDGIESTRTSVMGESAIIYAVLTDDAVETGYGLRIEAEARALAMSLGGIKSILVKGMNPEPYWRSNSSAGMMQTVEFRGYDYRGLKNLALALKEVLEKHPRVGEVSVNWNPRMPERNQLAVVFDRMKLADLGVNPYQVLQALRLELPGGYGAEVRVGEESMAMSFRLNGKEAPELDGILEGRVFTSGGAMELRDLVDIDTLEVPGLVRRENGEYVRTVAYSFLGAERMAYRFRESLLENLELPPGYRIYDESYIPFWLRENDTDFDLLVIMAILAVFAVTAVIFESFTAPLYILAVIPMALVGVVAGYWIFHRVFSPQAYVGSVFLVGIAVNNSILLVDSFQKKKKAGMEVSKAADLVVEERLRPILQTSLTTVIGLLPMVLWPMKQSADLWENLSFTVVCGMVVSTPLVLISLPALMRLTTRKGDSR